MKAWVLRGVNDMAFEDVPMPIPKEWEVLVEVRAAGICSSDIPRVFASGAYHYPIILGHEFSGVTAGGRRVGVFPLIPCHKCESCLSGHYETCSDYSYIGSRQDGAFAEFVAVPEWNLIPLPDDMTFQQAALLEPAAVALHSVRRLEASLETFNLRSAAVVGDGVIGKLIAKWLALHDVADVALLGRNGDTNRERYDACFEAAGSSDALRRCIEIVKSNGQIVLVGNPNASFGVGQKLYWQILRKQIIIRGSWNSSYPDDWQRVVECAWQLRLDGFISHEYGLSGLGAALGMMRDKREKYSKVLVNP